MRAQIVAFYSSLKSLLDDVPSIRQSFFLTGEASEPRAVLDRPDLRYRQLSKTKVLVQPPEAASVPKDTLNQQPQGYGATTDDSAESSEGFNVIIFKFSVFIKKSYRAALGPIFWLLPLS